MFMQYMHKCFSALSDVGYLFMSAYYVSGGISPLKTIF